MTVDVVFFVKDTQNAYPHLPKWQESMYSRIDGHRLAMNEYYLNHPKHVLGKLAAVDIYDRKGLSCVTDRAHYAELGRLVQTLPPLRKDAFSLEYMKLEVLDKRLGTINQKIAMLNQSRSALLLDNQVFSNLLIFILRL
ncbi:MAG: hypothetical protein GY782_10850, partial [Gammaproteobacteria bacterium]|nr:hypothetical protein [Gammaproteobacteria bacterium]